MSEESKENKVQDLFESYPPSDWKRDLLMVLRFIWMILFPIIYLAVCMLDWLIKILAGIGILFSIGVFIMGLSTGKPQYVFIGMFYFVVATAIGHIKEMMDAYIEKGNKS